MAYLIWKLVHVISVILFVGNITTGVFWAANAIRSNDAALIGRTFEVIIRADRWFTTLRCHRADGERHRRGADR